MDYIFCHISISLRSRPGAINGHTVLKTENCPPGTNVKLSKWMNPAISLKSFKKNCLVLQYK